MSKNEKAINTEDVKKITSDLEKMGIEEYKKDYGLTLEYMPSENGLDIRYILTSKEHRGKGIEKDIMKIFCVILDKNKTYARYRITNENDFEYYETLGFIREDGNILTRIPK